MSEEQIGGNQRESPFSTDYLAGIIKSVTASSTETQQPQASSPTPATHDVFSSLLSNPDLLKKLPTIISTIKPILELLGSTAQNSEARPASVSPSPPPQASVSENKKGGQDRRSALLCAMKPYLCKDRRDAIDYVIKISHLSDVLKTL